MNDQTTLDSASESPSQPCSQCGKSKAKLQCGLCQVILCKSCTEFLDTDYFSLLPTVPMEASHGAYCRSCMCTTVEPHMESYQQLIARAKEVLIYDKNQGKETRLIKRLEDPIRIEACADHNETILRLAVIATLAGFNSVIDVHIGSKKAKNGSYTMTTWSGHGIPANVLPERLIKDRSLTKHPN